MRRCLFVSACVLVAVLTGGAAAYAAPLPPFDTNSECLSCHGVLGSGAFTKVDFAVGSTVNRAVCASCHNDPFVNLSLDHQHTNTGCGDCHDGEAAFAFDIPAGAYTQPPSTWVVGYGYFTSQTSPYASPDTLHRAHAVSWVPEMFGSLDPACATKCHTPLGCNACHVSGAQHQSHGTASTQTCATAGCHSLSTAGTPGFNQPACSNCHAEKQATHGYETVDHVAADSSVGGVACTGCHSMDLKTEHDKVTSSSAGKDCGTCHPEPRNSVTAWDQACVTAGCHTPGSSAPLHEASTAAHAVGATGSACLDCHEGTDLAVIHGGAITDSGERSCLVCHGGGRVPASSDCTVCHFTFEQHYDTTAHASSWSLASCGGAACHTTTDLRTVHNEHRDAAEGDFGCATCHESTDPSVAAAISAGMTGCGDCHAGVSAENGHRTSHWAEPLLQDASGGKYSYYTGSAGSTPTADCIGCHSSNLMDEHLGVVDASSGAIERLPRKDASGSALTCASCHSSADLDVLTAIVTGVSACDACHTVHGPIADVHSSTYVASAAVDCSSCHASDLAAGHSSVSVALAGATLSGCDVCHGYFTGETGAAVQSAIESTNDTRCDACHPGVGSAHPDLGSHSATSGASLECGACHDPGATSIDTQAMHAGSASGACAVCHAAGSRIGDLESKSAECVTCHSTEGSDHHRGLPDAHTDAAMPSTCSSAGCHPSNLLPQVHQAYVDSTAVGESTCELCHLNQDPARIPADASAACDSCHGAIHPDMDHIADASQECVDCHETNDVTHLHANPDGSAACGTCHDNEARVPVLPSTVECGECHGDKAPIGSGHYDVAVHTALEPGCTNCHYLALAQEHAKASAGPVTCVACHEQQVDLLGTWDKTCADCHATKHADKNTKHASSNAACGGAGCHQISDVSTLHTGVAGGGCQVCHTSPDQPARTTDCASAGCHSGVTGDHESSHLTAGQVPSGCGGCHFTSLTGEHLALGYTCATCHSSANAAVKTAIADGKVSCSSCHPAVNGRNRHASLDLEQFVAANGSMHRVSAALPGMRSSFLVGGATYSWTLPSASTFLKSGWSTDSVVGCDGCHSYSSASGPHGSSVTVNIDPAYTTAWATAQLGGDTSRVICSKCHTGYRSMNEAHEQGDHNGPCIQCHAKIPHGWKLPRLLAYTDDPAAYASTRLTGIRLANHSPFGWSESDCAAACHEEHAATMSNRWPTQTSAVTPQPTAGNLALNKSASTSSEYGIGYGASKAVDGSTGSYWRSRGEGTEWLRIDLGSAQSVSKVVLNWNSSYYARSYRVETSMDGSQWTSRYSTWSGASGVRTHTFSAVNARYIRIYCTDSASSSYRLNEFEVWTR